jgi:hypothetical protein
MLMALYASLKQLDDLATRLETSSNELNSAIMGTPVPSPAKAKAPIGQVASNEGTFRT